MGGQRHEGRGQAPEAHPGAKVEVGGGQQGLEDADEAEGRAAVGDEVDLVAVGTQEGGDLLQSLGPGNTCRDAFLFGVIPSDAFGPDLKDKLSTHMDSSDTLTFSQPSGGSLLNM